MTGGHRDNVYLLLDLDPEVTDRATIEARIDDKQKEWSRQRSSGSAAQRRRAEHALSRMDHIREVMADEDKRVRHAKEARALLREQRREEARQLDAAIEVLRVKGGRCDEKQVDRLAKDLETFGRAAVEARLRKAGVSIGDEPASAGRGWTAKPGIDPTRARDVASELEHLGFPDLYAFLELNPRSSPQALRDRADEIYKQELGRARKDSDSSARQKLAGLAKTLFADQDAKERYDNHLSVAAMEDLKGHLELAGGDGFLTVEVVDALVRQARQRGVAADDARGWIEDYAAKRKWGVQRAGTLEAESLRLCGFCFELAPQGAARCAGCGEALEAPCPRCGAVQPTSDAACTACGCRIGDAPLVRELLAEGERLGRQGEWEAAVEVLDRALDYWPGWEPAETAKHRVLAAHPPPAPAAPLKVTPLTTGFRLAWGAAAGRGLRYRVVRKADGVPHGADDGDTVAEVGGTSLDDTAVPVGQALHYAVFTVRHGIASAGAVTGGPFLRVADVDDLRVQAADGQVRLTWRSPPSCRDIEIWRRAGRPPTKRGDGELLGTAADGWRDGDVKNGTLYGYRVVALFRDAAAPGGERTAAGVTATATPSVPEPPESVRKLSAQRSGRGLMLRWTWPDGCDEVTVRYAHDDFPRGPEGTGGATVRVTRREYNRAGGWLLHGAERRPHHFAVFAHDAASGLVSPPTRLVSGAGARRVVSYRVERGGGLFSRSAAAARVELSCNGDGVVELPPLLLVAKAGSVPVAPGDGQVVGEASGVRLEDGRATIPVEQSGPGRRSYLKLFFKDPAAAGQVRLLPAAQKELRL